MLQDLAACDIMQNNCYRKERLIKKEASTLLAHSALKRDALLSEAVQTCCIDTKICLPSVRSQLQEVAWDHQPTINWAITNFIFMTISSTWGN
jgi:hypothetical protein